MRPIDEVRASQRHKFDDPGAGPSHAPQGEAGGDLQHFHCWLEVVLQGIPEGMWSHI
jgi:hypothetical protein